MAPGLLAAAVFLAVFSLVPLTAEAAGERYATGIGAEVIPMTDGTRLVIVKIFPNSPAERAGLKEMDVLLEIDDKPITGSGGCEKQMCGKKTNALSHLDVYALLKSREAGRTYSIKVLRGVQERKPSEWTVSVTVGTYDHLFSVLRSSPQKFLLSFAGGSVELTSGVTEKKPSGRFVYRYAITNKGPSTILVEWDFLSFFTEAASGEYILRLAPKETREAVVERFEEPRPAAGTVRIWSEGVPRTQGGTLPKGGFILRERGTADGFLPSGIGESNDGRTDGFSPSGMSGNLELAW